MEINQVYKPFTYVELFAGIGGVSFGFDKVGGKCLLASEIDKYAIKAYNTLHPNVEVRGDIMEINEEDVPDHDILSFTTPCQSFSVAGKRLGFEDARGTLVFEALRIAKHKQPKILFMENVKGLVNHDSGRTLDTILSLMSEIGYTVDYDVLNSKYFGVPQNRERIFIIGVRNNLIESEEWKIEGNNIVSKAKKRIDKDTVRTFNFNWPSQESVTTRLRDILEREVEEKYYISKEKADKLVAKLEESQSDIKKIGWIEKDRDQKRVHSVTGIMPTITANNQGGRSPGAFIVDEETEVKIKQNEHRMMRHIDLKGHDSIKRVYDPEGISPTLTTMGGHREPKIIEDQIPVDYSRKTGIGNERDIALCLSSRDWRGLNRNQKQNAVLDVKSLGNVNPSGKGMNGQVYDGVNGISPTITTNKGEGLKIMTEVRATLTPDREEKRQNGRRFKENDEEAFTVNTQDKHGVAIGNYPKYRIRKLTPKECFRLQGFKDEDFEKLTVAGISNSQLYKMAGNAVTVNVIEAIGEKLLPYLHNEKVEYLHIEQNDHLENELNS